MARNGVIDSDAGMDFRFLDLLPSVPHGVCSWVIADIQNHVKTMVQILAKSDATSHEDVVKTHNDETVKLMQNHTKTSSVIGNKSKELFALLAPGIVALFSANAMAEALHGRVVGVSDGDTITVLDITNQQHKIRLSGIDAPEKAQPFGQRSKENLSRHVFGRDVSVEWHKQDRYKRIVGNRIEGDDYE